ncbi:uncharacterized protein FIBRA_01048 [Fibroporia radiculosa]|uniref:Uncharacterized protein n=1 Tax=Fibroporia radiculosa TaxID=599839 RepID=J4H0W1_9APHY|nr:uncharacterized protein FIBRA_01048 [Fibroporia radiculosa]CCL99039.1 predicted protein [Fibroporia radiculosa]
MNTSRDAARSLNYFQPSPVRGQLENLEGHSRNGWRYLQCTDTPNELRVLLPPRTALIYSHLLKAELAELAKDRNASWDRILEIRHLKDRMIRKCQRMARASAPAGKQPARSTFFTVHAPPDFRVKEMERWFRTQGANFTDDTKGGAQAATSYCCSKCGPLPSQSGSHVHRRGPSPPRRQTTARAPLDRAPIRRVDSVSQTTTLLNPSPPPQPQKQIQRQAHKSHVRAQSASVSKGTTRIPSVVREADRHPPTRSKSVDRKRSASSVVSTQSHAGRLSAKSPDPLPIPFRTHDPELDIPFVSDSPSTLAEELPDVSDAPLPMAEPSPSPPNGTTLPTIHEGSEVGADDTARRPLPRRRSSLKKSNSISRLSVGSVTKSVAWAMDRDWIEQMSKYMKAANEAEVLGHELEELRTGYHAEVKAMRLLCQNVSEASERIRQEMDKLHRDEEDVRKHENKLLFTIDQLEKKETQFREKVLSVLEETKHVVSMCDKKREDHDA